MRSDDALVAHARRDCTADAGAARRDVVAAAMP